VTDLGLPWSLPRKQASATLSCRIILPGKRENKAGAKLPEEARRPDLVWGQKRSFHRHHVSPGIERMVSCQENRGICLRVTLRGK
jgi:hypothetical protein